MKSADILHDESLMPMRMGSPFRTPFHSLGNWGLQPLPEQRVVELYQLEWENGDAGQLGLVTQASVKAGFGDYPEILRMATGQVVGEHLKNQPSIEPISILDLGAGPGRSSLAVYRSLPENLKEWAELILLDPSAGSLQDAKGFFNGEIKNYRTVHGTDLQIPYFFEDESVDVITAVASIHHHSKIPSTTYYDALKPGGIMVLADWHNSVWEHPASVMEFLEQFDWSKKKQGLANWQEAYPKAKQPALAPKDPFDQQANSDIKGFWGGYNLILKERGELGNNAIWPLEGHRPVGRYIEELQAVGFSTNTPDIHRLISSGAISSNPHRLLPNSSLLQITVAQKPYAS